MMTRVRLGLASMCTLLACGTGAPPAATRPASDDAGARPPVLADSGADSGVLDAGDVGDAGGARDAAPPVVVTTDRCDLRSEAEFNRVHDAGIMSRAVYTLWGLFPNRGDGLPKVFPTAAELQAQMPVDWGYLDYFLGDYLSRGFATLGAHDGVCYLGFKGTEETGDVAADIASFVMSDCTTASGQPLGRCGSGFFTILQALRAPDVPGFSRGRILERVRAWQQHPACAGGLVLTGHSLGGSLTDAFVANFYAEYASVLPSVTIAAPRVFETAAADRLHAIVGDAKIRIARRGDFAPGIPARSLGFEHFGRTLELSQAVFQNAGTWSLLNVARTHEPITGPYHFIAEYLAGIDAACAPARPAP